MTRIQHGLSVVLIAAIFCPIAWVYGGGKKQGGTLVGSVPPVSMHQSMDRAGGNEPPELAALDAGAHPPWAGDDRQKVQALFAGLNQRGITIKPTLYKLLGLVPLAQRSQLVSRCQVFFDSVDTLEIPNTGCLTSMIQKKNHAYSLLSQSDDTVRHVAKTPALRSVTSLFNGRGFPQPEEDTQAFMEWEIWWQGEGQGRTLDRELLRTFSSIFNGKGIPDKKVVDDYLQWKIWWLGESEARTLDRELLRTFSSMFHGKGLPDKKSVDNYLQWEIWWQGEGDGRTLDRELLRTFSSMLSSRGVPNKKAVDDYLQLDVWWQGEGQTRTLDRKLLRSFSSIFSRKGLPDKQAVEDYLQLDIWWQGEGEARTLDRDLLRTFSSMLSGRGRLDKQAVEDYLQWEIWWQGEGEARILDRELLHTFSSMFNGRGLPNKKVVDNYLQLDVWWQGEGEARTLDRQLLRIFSSMFNGRGLPDKKSVDDYLKRGLWWQGEGKARTLDRELLRIFSSMFCCRGLPNKKAVDDYLQLDVWWQGEGKTRTLDRKLLRAFSSMFNCRGLPDKQSVKEYLQWEIWWQGEGRARTLDRELLRAFSSMFNGRGLPNKKAVEDYLQQDIWWQGEGRARWLDRDLLRIFSSMFNGRGLPDKKIVDDYLQWGLWQQGTGNAHTLDRDLLHIFSLMFCSRGLPDQKAVDDYLQLDFWWQGEGPTRTLDRGLLRIFSSMFNRRGLPDKKSVEEYLQWEFWWRGEGEARTLDRELLGAFSSMFHCKGLPDKHRTDEIIQWLTTREERWDRQTVKVMARLYSGAYTGHKSLGLPNIKELRRAEQKLMALIPTEERDQNKDDELIHLIKMVALYLANDGGIRQLHWTDCEAWLQEHPDSLAKKDVFRKLLLTLHFHGGQGVKEAMALIMGKPEATKRFVLDALSRGQALVALRYALQAIEPSERRDYLFFTRELQLAPSCQQWQTIKGHLKTLAPVWSNRESQRRFLTLIWPLSAKDQRRFIQPETVHALATLLPSAEVMRKLSKSLTTTELRTLFDTYLTYRAGQLNKEGLPILFKALLLAQLPLFDHGPITPGVLTQTQDQPEGVVVRVSPVIGAEDAISLFIQVIAALMGELWNCEYTVNRQTLTLWPHSATVPITFPTPSLEWHPDGVQIRHWTSADLHRFYQATEYCQGLCRELAESGDSRPAAPHPPATLLETVLRQSVLSEADINQLHTFRDQLTSNQVVDILFRMDQSVSRETTQRWQSLLGEKHQQDWKSNSPWLDGSSQAMEAVRDVEDILRDLFSDVLL